MSTHQYDERLHNLLRTAADVFAQQGYHATSMRDLSKATGMSLAGMYYYVRCKDELLYQIQERCFMGVLAGARSAIESGTDPAARIDRLIQHHVTFFTEHMSEMKVLSHEADSLTSERQESINQLKKQYVTLLADLIGDAQEDAAKADKRVAAYALFGMMNWIYTWYDPEGDIKPQDLAEHFSEIFLHGILTSTTSALSHGG
ncbi:MAG: TetR family transcriptional regulator [Gemmatimonadota bacterium]|nr:MAG: TetR family transcriptional regulator [Gemmatimonadota bacterium]